MIPKALSGLVEWLTLVSARLAVVDVVQRSGDRTPLVAFVGFQEQGKSSLINALLGQKLVPEGGQPGAPAVCELLDADEAHASFLSDGRWQPVAFAERAKYADQTPRGRSAIDAGRIGFPSPFLSRVIILDTHGPGAMELLRPGSGASGTVDLLVLVCSLHRPIARDDVEILDTARIAHIPVICVVTKADQADDDDPEADIEKVVAFNRSVLTENGVVSEPIIPVSVRRDADPGSPVFGAIEALKEVLLRGSAQARVLRLFQQCASEVTGLIDASSEGCDSLFEAISAERVRLAETHSDIERLGHSRNDRLAMIAAAVNKAKLNFEEDAYWESALLECVPGQAAVNRQRDVEVQWILFRNASWGQFVKIRQHYLRAIKHEIDIANDHYAFQNGALERLHSAAESLPQIASDLPQEPPGKVKREPGFMAETFGLHGEFVRGVIIDKLFGSYRRGVASFMKAAMGLLNELQAACVDAAEHEFTLQRETLRNAEDSCRSMISQLESEMEEHRAEIKRLESRLELCGKDLVRHKSVLIKCWSIEAGLAPSDVAALHVTPELSETLRGIIEYMKGAYFEAARALGESSPVNRSFDQDVARLYWISRCRSATDTLEPMPADEHMAVLDPQGAGFWRNVEDESGYTAEQRIVVSALGGREMVETGTAHIEAPLHILVEVALIAIDRGRASAVTSAELDLLGAPSVFIELRERYADRLREGGARGPLATFLESVSDVLVLPEMETDLVARLRSHAQGEVPDDRRISSITAYLRHERWRAIAI